MKDLDVRIQRLENEIDDLKKLLAKPGEIDSRPPQ
jgi:hypothetical protein